MAPLVTWPVVQQIQDVAVAPPVVRSEPLDEKRSWLATPYEKSPLFRAEAGLSVTTWKTEMRERVWVAPFRRRSLFRKVFGEWAETVNYGQQLRSEVNSAVEWKFDRHWRNALGVYFYVWENAKEITTTTAGPRVPADGSGDESC